MRQHNGVSTCSTYFDVFPRLFPWQVVGRMFLVSFPANSEILQQGALPKDNDCMYYLHQGQAEVVISGAMDRSSSKQIDEENKTVQGNRVRILQHPGWAFGDLALLFSSARTASVVAKTEVQVYALDRSTFLQFVMKHASVSGRLQLRLWGRGLLKLIMASIHVSSILSAILTLM